MSQLNNPYSSRAGAANGNTRFSVTLSPRSSPPPSILACAPHRVDVEREHQSIADAQTSNFLEMRQFNLLGLFGGLLGLPLQTLELRLFRIAVGKLFCDTDPLSKPRLA